MYKWQIVSLASGHIFAFGSRLEIWYSNYSTPIWFIRKKYVIMVIYCVVYHEALDILTRGKNKMVKIIQCLINRFGLALILEYHHSEEKFYILFKYLII